MVSPQTPVLPPRFHLISYHSTVLSLFLFDFSLFLSTHVMSSRSIKNRTTRKTALSGKIRNIRPFMKAKTKHYQQMKEATGGVSWYASAEEASKHCSMQCCKTAACKTKQNGSPVVFGLQRRRAPLRGDAKTTGESLRVESTLFFLFDHHLVIPCPVSFSCTADISCMRIILK